MLNIQFAGWKCGKAMEFAPAGRVGSRESRPKCEADLHACRNCRFYDPSKHHRCAEPLAEWVRSNEAAKKKFDSLFKV